MPLPTHMTKNCQSVSSPCLQTLRLLDNNEYIQPDASCVFHFCFNTNQCYLPKEVAYTTLSNDEQRLVEQTENYIILPVYDTPY